MWADLGIFFKYLTLWKDAALAYRIVQIVVLWLISLCHDQSWVIVKLTLHCFFARRPLYSLAKKNYLDDKIISLSSWQWFFWEPNFWWDIQSVLLLLSFFLLGFATTTFQVAIFLVTLACQECSGMKCVTFRINTTTAEIVAPHQVFKRSTVTIWERKKNEGLRFIIYQEQWFSRQKPVFWPWWKWWLNFCNTAINFFFVLNSVNPIDGLYMCWVEN